MYNLGDNSYKQQPVSMSQDVVDAAIAKIAEHASLHGLKTVVLIFHGGEPLLASKDFYREFVSKAKSAFLPNIKPRFVMQTNGTLLSPEWLELFLELGISFGISLDGTPEAHDANRLDHQGRGSYKAVIDALGLVKSDNRYADLFQLNLTVINIESDPLVVYRHLRANGLKGVEFLFPDGTYDHLPPGKTLNGEETPYADWLIPIFDEWFDNPNTDYRIRVFDNIMRLVFGSRFSTSDIGGNKNGYVVIETDGGIEPVDSLKVCGEGFTKLGINVTQNKIDDIYDSPLAQSFIAGADSLCETCKRCPIVDVCGGGYMPHRYREENSFDNPSLYCKDLMKLIAHIQEKVLMNLPVKLRQSLKLATLTELTENNSSVQPQVTVIT